MTHTHRGYRLRIVANLAVFIPVGWGRTLRNSLSATDYGALIDSPIAPTKAPSTVLQIISHHNKNPTYHSQVHYKFPLFTSCALLALSTVLAKLRVTSHILLYFCSKVDRVDHFSRNNTTYSTLYTINCSQRVFHCPSTIYY